MKYVLKKVGKVFGSVAVAAPIFAGQAHAGVVLTGVTLDTATPELLAATVLSALGVIWGIRKLVKLINRS